MREKGKAGLFQGKAGLEKKARQGLPVCRSNLGSKIESDLRDLVRCSWMPLFGLDNQTSLGMAPDTQQKER